MPHAGAVAGDAPRREEFETHTLDGVEMQQVVSIKSDGNVKFQQRSHAIRRY